MAENSHSIGLSIDSDHKADEDSNSGNRTRDIKLCESTLRLQTRDVYGQTLSKGQWKCTVKHNGAENLQLDIKIFDQESYQWSSVIPKKAPCMKSGMTKIEHDFSVTLESEVKFIISANSAEGDIQYSCNLLLISHEDLVI